MGPTIEENNALDFAVEFNKNHCIEINIDSCGLENITAKLTKENQKMFVEKIWERTNKQENVELFNLGRLNFKN